jgi:hypothetical protein
MFRKRPAKRNLAIYCELPSLTVGLLTLNRLICRDLALNVMLQKTHCIVLKKKIATRY